MKKSVFFILISTLLHTYQQGNAQNGFPIVFNKHNNLQASRFHPSLLGDSPYNFQMNLVNVYAWAATNTLSVNDVRSIIDESIGNQQIDKALDHVKQNARLSAGVYFPIPLLNLAVKTFKKDPGGYKSELFTFSVNVAARGEVNALLPKELLDFIWKGNKQALGENVSLEKTTINALSLGEIGLGAAFPVYDGLDLRMRTGIRMKYILGGLGGVNVRTQNFSGNITTLENNNNTNATIRANSFYLMNLNDFDKVGENLFAINGQGFGVDLGATAYYQDNYVFTLSLLDVGAVKYTKNVKNFQSASGFTFEGVELGIENSDPENILDSLFNEFEGEETQNAYRTPLPMRVSLQAEYRIQDIDAKQREYDRHTFYFSIVQGFRNYGIASKRPQVAAGYNLGLGRTFNVGSSLSLGGNSGFGWGAFTSVRGGAFTFGVGTSNLLFLLNQNSRLGGDIALNLGFNF